MWESHKRMWIGTELPEKGFDVGTNFPPGASLELFGNEQIEDRWEKDTVILHKFEKKIHKTLFLMDFHRFYDFPSYTLL